MLNIKAASESTHKKKQIDDEFSSLIFFGRRNYLQTNKHKWKKNGTSFFTVCVVGGREQSANIISINCVTDKIIQTSFYQFNCFVEGFDRFDWFFSSSPLNSLDDTAFHNAISHPGCVCMFAWVCVCWFCSYEHFHWAKNLVVACCCWVYAWISVCA